MKFISNHSLMATLRSQLAIIGSSPYSRNGPEVPPVLGFSKRHTESKIHCRYLRVIEISIPFVAAHPGLAATTVCLLINVIVLTTWLRFRSLDRDLEYERDLIASGLASGEAQGEQEPVENYEVPSLSCCS